MHYHTQCLCNNTTPASYVRTLAYLLLFYTNSSIFIAQHCYLLRLFVTS
ncbi:hypothetical protein HMPREF1584_01051 [Gardnerella vaginalis JCP8481A]|uniref:Uncharacterized protein n=1 Tax=Gardnerella vaginalis TaxID=2702 RepID=A0A133P1A6_GARVA|nr:hypothetical protein HMPREF1584_01051 [Gardnerella vaginalis JCP8481A]EPI42529.1 hypothetical protein HMPREF1585_00839 [Gardnerella vaginalis JCP8481B]KXA22302.1 hypothetical protein HMPREF3208_00354 [Gardnerella vaginalis]